MYVVHFKLTLHIQVLVYCKEWSYPLDYGPTRNLSNLFYTAKQMGNKKSKDLWQSDLLRERRFSMKERERPGCERGRGVREADFH